MVSANAFATFDVYSLKSKFAQKMFLFPAGSLAKWLDSQESDLGSLDRPAT